MRVILGEVRQIDIRLGDRNKRLRAISSGDEGYFVWRRETLIARSHRMRRYIELKDRLSDIRHGVGRGPSNRAIVVTDPNDPADLLFCLHEIVDDLVRNGRYTPSVEEATAIVAAGEYLSNNGFFV